METAVELVVQVVVLGVVDLEEHPCP